MGEMVEFASNGGTAGLPRHAGRRVGARGPRHPGVVGPRPPHQGRVRPLRRRGLRGPGARPLPRRSRRTEPDEAGKLMMALNLEQAGKDLSGAVDLLQRAQRAATRSASSASAWAAAWPSCSPRSGPTPSRRRCRSTASSRGRRPSPTGRSSTPRCSATSPRTTGSSRPTMAEALESDAARPRQGRRVLRLRGRRPRLLQRHPARGLRRRAVPAGLGAHARALPHGAVAVESRRCNTQRP